ncbi:MAG: spore photoproduct lyase family protein [Limnochordia bacterium]
MKEHYRMLISDLAEALSGISKPSFELITHRFTKRARPISNGFFQQAPCPCRRRKDSLSSPIWLRQICLSQRTMEEIRDFFEEQIGQSFPQSEIKYLV